MNRLGTWWVWIFAFWFIVGAAMFVLSQPAALPPSTPTPTPLHFETGQLP